MVEYGRIKFMTTLEKTSRTIEKLKKEIKQLRSFIVSVAGEDPEGDYRSEFIKRVKRASAEKPIYEYIGPNSLTKLLENSKKR